MREEGRDAEQGRETAPQSLDDMQARERGETSFEEAPCNAALGGRRSAGVVKGALVLTRARSVFAARCV